MRRWSYILCWSSAHLESSDTLNAQRGLQHEAAPGQRAHPADVGMECGEGGVEENGILAPPSRARDLGCV